MGLRERAIARVQAGETTRSIAEDLGVAPSSVTKWWQRYQRTGSASPAQMGGYKPRIVRGAHRDYSLTSSRQTNAQTTSKTQDTLQTKIITI
ncbi:helix-turn-helix domain-containing protein [Asticcacaulis sp. BE141]|uniref:helix-turn-helix domain-containing protein n=1 Tax=Asticcacaulis TaxID=76890 RepID=UPI003857CD45